MKKKLTLSISQPCQEKWETFTPAAKGGFCGSCSKVVVDFTKMSDVEILEFFMQKPNNACGRFRPVQLTTYSYSNTLKINPGVTFLKAGFLSVLFLLVGKPTFAQTQKKTKTEIVDHRRNSVDVISTQDAEHTIKGVVLSGEDGSALPGVNVFLKGTTVGMVTDMDGRFEFPKKLKEGDVIIFSFIGLDTQEYVVPNRAINQFEISMKMELISTMGEVAVHEVYTAKPSSMRKFWAKVKSLL
jgi:hypothetical protein